MLTTPPHNCQRWTVSLRLLTIHTNTFTEEEVRGCQVISTVALECLNSKFQGTGYRIPYECVFYCPFFLCTVVTSFLCTIPGSITVSFSFSPTHKCEVFETEFLCCLHSVFSVRISNSYFKRKKPDVLCYANSCHYHVLHWARKSYILFFTISMSYWYIMNYPKAQWLEIEFIYFAYGSTGQQHMLGSAGHFFQSWLDCVMNLWSAQVSCGPALLILARRLHVLGLSQDKWFGLILIHMVSHPPVGQLNLVHIAAGQCSKKQMQERPYNAQAWNWNTIISAVF